MAKMDELNNKLLLKLVFYGPALSGKTTNLTKLHELLNPKLKGDMMVLETKNDRTLFFDLLPLGLTAPSGLLIKLKLFTVPGQVVHDSTRKAVLSRTDGIVFVADSQLTQGINNAESFRNLVENAAKVGIDFENIPLVVQFNKRDLKHIQPLGEIKQRWQQTRWPLYFSSALKSDGVIETFIGLLEGLYESINAKYDLANKHSLNKNDFILGIVGDRYE